MISISTVKFPPIVALGVRFRAAWGPKHARHPQIKGLDLAGSRASRVRRRPEPPKSDQAECRALRRADQKRQSVRAAPGARPVRGEDRVCGPQLEIPSKEYRKCSVRLYACPAALRRVHENRRFVNLAEKSAPLRAVAAGSTPRQGRRGKARSSGSRRPVSDGRRRFVRAAVRDDRRLNRRLPYGRRFASDRLFHRLHSPLWKC